MKSRAKNTLSPTIPVPRMAHLETLEAKMASIEVSLSTALRRRKSGSLGGRMSLTQSSPLPVKEKDNIIHSMKEQLNTKMNMIGVKNGFGAPPLAQLERVTADEHLSRLKTDMDDKRLMINNLKMALDRLQITDNIDVRIQQAELEYQLGREELELLTLLEQSRALQLLIEQDDYAKTKQDQQTIFRCIESLESVTLHAAELEYDPKSPQFGAGTRPRHWGLWLDWALPNTGMCKGDRLLEVNGKLVLSKSKEDMIRLLSISPSPAKLVVMRIKPRTTTSVTTANHVTSKASDSGWIKEKDEEGLRSDNLRLTHRITYLEEQVADLLHRNKSQDPEVQHISQHKMMTSTVQTQKNVTNINITSEPVPKINQQGSEVQVFQKGPDVTAIVANLPGLEIGTAETNANLPVIRPRSNQSCCAGTQIEIENSQDIALKISHLKEPNTRSCKSSHSHLPYNHKLNKNPMGGHRLHPSRSSHSLDYGEDSLDFNSEMKKYGIRQSQSHNFIHKSRDSKEYDYNSETSSALQIIRRNQRQLFEANYANTKEQKYFAKTQSDDNSDIMKHSKKESRKSSILEYFDSRRNNKDTSDIKSVDTSDTEKHSHKERLLGRKSILLNRKMSKTPNIQGLENNEFHPDRDYVDHRIDGKIIQNAHKSSRRMSRLHVRNLKSPDCDSEPSQNDVDKYKKNRTKVLDYTSEPNSVLQGHYKKQYDHLDRPRPNPPKKPLRLSLHRAQSMQSVEQGDTQANRFYLHDLSQTDGSASSVLNGKLSNSDKKILADSLFSANKNKVDSHFNYIESGHTPTKRCLDNEGVESAESFPFDEYHTVTYNDYTRENGNKIKKRMHNGKLSLTSSQTSVTHNNEDIERYNRNMKTKSGSLSSISPKSPNAITEIHSGHCYNSASNSTDTYVLSGGKNRPRSDVHSKIIQADEVSNSGRSSHSNYDQCESASERSRTSHKSASGFRWPSSSVFKNIEIRSSSKISDK